MKQLEDQDERDHHDHADRGRAIGCAERADPHSDGAGHGPGRGRDGRDVRAVRSKPDAFRDRGKAGADEDEETGCQR